MKVNIQLKKAGVFTRVVKEGGTVVILNTGPDV